MEPIRQPQKTTKWQGESKAKINPEDDPGSGVPFFREAARGIETKIVRLCCRFVLYRVPYFIRGFRMSGTARRNTLS
jgi:hypothetical protein